MLCPIGQLHRFGERCGERLLDQNVLAGFQRGAHQIEVGGGGGCDRHGGDGGISEHLLIAGRRLDGRVAAENGPRPLLVEIAQPLELKRGGGDSSPDEVWPPVSGADHSEPDGGHDLGSPLFRMLANGHTS